MRRSFVLALVLCVASGGPTTHAKDPTRVMRGVGALHCLARLDQRSEAIDTTRLECQFRLMGPRTKAQFYEGEIVGTGLWLVDPGPVRLAWHVLAPTRQLDVHALAGDYDTVSSHDLALAKTSPNILFGGKGESIALELMAPVVDGISPSTRLTLRVARQS